MAGKRTRQEDAGSRRSEGKSRKIEWVGENEPDGCLTDLSRDGWFVYVAGNSSLTQSRPLFHEVRLFGSAVQP